MRKRMNVKLANKKPRVDKSGFTTSGDPVEIPDAPHTQWRALTGGFTPLTKEEFAHVRSVYPLSPEPDPINAPAHYRAGDTYQTILVIEAWDLGFRLGSVIKYISRAGRKDGNTMLSDLKKAQFYLNREVTVLEAAEKAK